MINGSKIWVIAGGRIPLRSTGPEPALTSRDWISVLNSNDSETKISITIYHSERAPAGPFEIKVKGNRSKKIRMNDLVDPEPLLLDEDYAAVVRSDHEVVIQFSRMDTSQARSALLGTTAFASD